MAAVPALRVIRAVSYTHLYPFGYEHYLERKARENQGGSMAAQIRAEAVSYTHLDVYKRQVIV